MVATRGRTFKRPWRRSCLSSKLKSSSAPIGRKDSWCFHAVGSSNAPLLGSTAAEGLPRIGRTSIATRWRFCGLPQSASCSESFVIPPDVFGQTLKDQNRLQLWTMIAANAVAFYCVAQWDSISTSGIESLFKHAANLLPVGFTIILTTVANALISSDSKARLVFFRWKHALPGHRAFSKYAQSDPRVDMTRVRRALGNKMPGDAEQEN